MKQLKLLTYKFETLKLTVNRNDHYSNKNMKYLKNLTKNKQTKQKTVQTTCTTPASSDKS